MDNELLKTLLETAQNTQKMVASVVHDMSKLSGKLDTHVALDKYRYEQLDNLDNIVNGVGATPSLPEQIRTNAKRIEAIAEKQQAFEGAVKRVVWEAMSVPLKWLGVGIIVMMVAAALWMKG